MDNASLEYPWLFACQWRSTHLHSFALAEWSAIHFHSFSVSEVSDIHIAAFTVIPWCSFSQDGLTVYFTSFFDILYFAPADEDPQSISTVHLFLSSTRPIWIAVRDLYNFWDTVPPPVLYSNLQKTKLHNLGSENTCMAISELERERSLKTQTKFQILLSEASFPLCSRYVDYLRPW